VRRAAPLLMFVGFLSGCSARPTASAQAAPDASEKQPNVILIVLDTLRAEQLSCYGYARQTSPNLDAFAAGATRYARALNASPWTLPSHASLFTGLYPFEHGAHSFPIETKIPKNAYPLDERHETLTEALAAEGYQTAAFVCNVGYLGPWTRMDQGFELYRCRSEYVEEQLPRVLEWVEREAKAPFFLFLNWMDTHRPYNTRPRPGFIDPPAPHERREQKPKLVQRLANTVMRDGQPAPEALRQRVVDQYDTAIANQDEQLGRLFDRLRALALFEDAVILVTSDHGEYFGEHFLVEHSKDVYQEALWAPLIIKGPGQREGAVDETLVSSVDLPDLILRRLPKPLASRLAPKFPYKAGQHALISENYYSRTKDLFNPRYGDRFKRVRTALFEWPYKYIRSSDGKHELYDLGADPREADNLFASQPERAAAMARRLEAFEASRPRATGQHKDESAPTPAELQELEALGYVGGAGDDGEEEAAPEEEPRRPKEPDRP